MKIRPIQRQSILSLIFLITVTAIGYLATVYFAHVLGPAILGSYYLIIAYFGIFDIISCGGFGGAAIKRISEGKEQNEFFTASIILRFVLLTASVFIFILASPYLEGISSSQIFWLFIITLVVGAINGVCSLDVQGTARIGIWQVGNFLNTLTKIIVQVLAIFAGWGLGGLVFGFIMGMVASTVINFSFIRLKLTKCNLSHFKNLASYAFWTFLSSEGALIFSYADTILISYFLDIGEVGIYRIAFQLAAISTIALTALYSVLFPRISRWNAENKIPLIQLVLSKAITSCLVLAIPITAGGIVLSQKLMYFLYGTAFQSGSSCLIILLIAQIANIFMYLFTMCLSAVDRPKESFYITMISAVINICFMGIFIPLFGIDGAAFGLLLTMVINALFAYLMLRPVVKVPLEMKSIASIVLSSGVMVVFLLGFYLISGIRTFPDLIFAVVLGGLIYTIFLIKIDRSIQDTIKNILTDIGIFE